MANEQYHEQPQIRQTNDLCDTQGSVEVIEKNWPILKEREFYIVDGQHSLMAVKALSANDEWKNPLKEAIRY